MPLYRDEVVVLRTHKLGEADRIVTMLSRQHGKIRAVAKGVRRTASKFGSRLEPFMVADAQFYEGRSLDIITQAESIGSYGAAITSDYGSYTAASAMVETADKLTEDDGSLQQYLLLVGALRSLARREHTASLTLDSFLLRSFAIAGWSPSFHDCAMTGAPGPHSAFVVQLGGVVADAVAVNVELLEQAQQQVARGNGLGRIGEMAPAFHRTVIASDQHVRHDRLEGRVDHPDPRGVMVELAEAWIRSGDPVRRDCGYGLLYEASKLPPKKAPDEAFFLGIVERIASTIDREPERVRLAMATALMGIGKRTARLNAAALKVARAVGPIEFTSASGTCEPFDVAKHLDNDRLREKFSTVR